MRELRHGLNGRGRASRVAVAATVSGASRERDARRADRRALRPQARLRRGPERPRVAGAGVRGPVELRRRAVALAHDLEPLAALAAGDRAEAVALHALEDGRTPPLGRPGAPCLQPAFAPGEDELGALRSPAPEDAREIGRCGLARPP